MSAATEHVIQLAKKRQAWIRVRLCVRGRRLIQASPRATPKDESQKRRRPTREPGSLPPPRVIRINSSGKITNKPRVNPIPEPPPLSDPVSRTISGIVSNLPGFRDITASGFRRPDYEDGKEVRKRPLVYGDWASDIEYGDDWDYRPGGAAAQPTARDTRARYPNTRTPRDSFMRPIADPIGVMDRLSWDRVSREERLAAEATLNRRESRAALVFAGLWLFLIPFGLGFFFSRGVAEPVVYFTQEHSPERLALTDKMKREGAAELRMEVLRLRMEANIGKAPPLTDEEVFHQLQEKAHEFEHEKREEIRIGLVNIISDSVTISVFLVTLAAHVEGRTALTNTIGRISQGMSQTGKAFILILAADVLMGYHSEEGWTAGIELLSEHYMVEVGHGPIAIFVSTVPVILDTAFKWWLFKGLNRIDPSASVTLSEIDRH
eukprot:jgi/Ulvmu1/8115/UM040_0010.1